MTAHFQLNLSADQAPSGRRYLSVIVERTEQDARGVWQIPTVIDTVASFPVDRRWQTGNPWSDGTRRPAERFMWELERDGFVEEVAEKFAGF